MSAASGLRSTGLLATARRFAWEHPEWWVIGLACLAWLPMLEHGVDHAGHALHVMPPSAELTHWLLMIAAMMFPLVLDPLRNVAFRSYRRRRHLAMVELLAGYLPKQLSDEELREIVVQAVEEVRAAGAEGPRAMGQVMKIVNPKVAGLAEGGRVAAIVKQQLAGG